MTSGDLSQREAILRLATSTSDAIVGVLERLAPGQVTRGEVTILGEDQPPFSLIEPGTAAAGVAYSDGATGANVFIAPPRTAHVLAQAMGGQPVEAVAEGDEDPPIGELELSAVSEAANQLMAAAAAALTIVLGHEINISPPTTQLIDGADDAERMFGTAPHAASTSFNIAGAACRLVQLIPSAFVVRVARAIDDLESGVELTDAPAGDDASPGLTEALSEIKVRVWAELGRTALPLRDALELPLGAVVDLDRNVEAPVDLYVNGLRFAHGRLLVSDDDRWAFQLDELVSPSTVPSLSVPTPFVPQLTRSH
jgi:flagellar motor switch protein FliN/FliY